RVQLFIDVLEYTKDHVSISFDDKNVHSVINEDDDEGIEDEELRDINDCDAQAFGIKKDVKHGRITYRGRYFVLHFACWMKQGAVVPVYSAALQSEYGQRFIHANRDLFEAVAIAIGKIDPNFKKLQSYLDDYLKRKLGLSLPIAGMFGGIAYNHLARTTPHKDNQDLGKGWCFIVPTGTFTGGQLELIEPGVVLNLAEKDLAGFRSALITHHNWRISGNRCSLVFFTCHVTYYWLLRTIREEGDYVKLKEVEELTGYSEKDYMTPAYLRSLGKRGQKQIRRKKRDQTSKDVRKKVIKKK
ncbi:hypothetical protein HDU96_002702, partial [Phlyctochytrium bullatum]